MAEPADYPELPAELVEHLGAREESWRLVSAEKLYRVLCGVRAGMGLKASLAEVGVSDTSWYEWAEKYPGLREALLAAQTVGTHALAQQCLAIADEVEEDRDAVAKAKLRIDTRTYLMRVWHRQFYGDDGAQAQSHTYVINADLGGNVASQAVLGGVDGNGRAGGHAADPVDSGVERIGQGGVGGPARAGAEGGAGASGRAAEDSGAVEGEA